MWCLLDSWFCCGLLVDFWLVGWFVVTWLGFGWVCLFVYDCVLSVVLLIVLFIVGY